MTEPPEQVTQPLCGALQTAEPGLEWLVWGECDLKKGHAEGLHHFYNPHTQRHSWWGRASLRQTILALGETP